MPRTRPTRISALACCLGLLAAPLAFAQGGGGGGSGGGGASGSAAGGASSSTGGAAGAAGSPSMAPGATPGASQPGTSMLGSGGAGGAGQGGGQAGGGQAGQPGQTGTSPGPTGPNRRVQTESRIQGSGAARPPQQDEQQLRDLNAISRELTPGTPVPAPEADGGRTRR